MVQLGGSRGSIRSGGSRVLLAQTIDQLDERRRIDGLREMVVEPCRGRGALVIHLAPARQGDQREVGKARVLSQPARDLISVEARHADVEESNLRPKLRS